MTELKSEAAELLARIRARRAAEPDLVPTTPLRPEQAARLAAIMWPTHDEAGR